MKQAKRIAIRIMESNPEMVDLWMTEEGFMREWTSLFLAALNEDADDLEVNTWSELEKLYDEKKAA